MGRKKHISKKAIHELLSDVRGVGQGLGWDVRTIGAYSKNDKIEIYVGYSGQGIDENVYNHDYDNLVEFTDIYNEWTINLITKSVAVDNIQGRINNSFFERKDEKPKPTK